MEFEEFEEIEKVRGKPKKTGGIRAIATKPGQVIGIGPTGCRVLMDEEAVACKPKTGLAVGDFVSLDELGNIRTINPRSTTLSRPDPTNPHLERIIAANIDAVLMVVTIRSPDFRPGLIDRYLIAIEKGLSQPILCVNKIDLVPSEDEFQVLRPYENLGIHIIRLSTKTGDGLAELRAALAGKLAVFVGHSGVGKSSLTNALKPEAKAITSHISQYYQKGRHITTGSTMYQLADGLRLIDTPGVREFGLWQLSPTELAGYFHDFDEPSKGCQFVNCTHTHEPICGVREAVEDGTISVQRFETYLRIRETIS